jgi:hypothetical protein
VVVAINEINSAERTNVLSISIPLSDFKYFMHDSFFNFLFIRVIED